MKRKVVLLLGAFCLLSVLSCSKEDAPSPSNEGGGSVEYYNENFAENMDLSWYGGGSPPLEDNSWGELQKEKLFNLNMTVIRADTVETQAALFASGNIPDVIIATPNTPAGIAALAGQGIIGEIPIEKIQEFMPNLYASGLEMDSQVFTYSMVGGKNMAIPRYYYTASTRSPVIRADWLKAVGMPIPKTLAEYEETLAAFREKDPDGDGVRDTYGMTGFVIEGNDALSMFASNFGAYGINPYFWRVADNGDVEFGFTTDEFVEALKTLRRWYQRGIIDPEFITNEYRTSGEDIAYKFANGRIGMMEAYSFDDYQIDNDGHVTAKWTAVHENWKKFFEDNAGNAEEMYKYDVPTDFDDTLIEPYYIALDPPVGPNGKSGSRRDDVIATRICVGKQVENDPEKLERILRMLEAEFSDPEVAINHIGPLEHGQWMWEDGIRVMNPNQRDNPFYHPQGVLDGTIWNLWPMWFCSKMSTELIGGAKNIQRYVRTFPIFQYKPNIPNVVQGALPSAGDTLELTSTYIRDYIVLAIRGDVDIDATYPKMRADWFAMGGEQLTKEANEWYKSANQ